MEERDKRSLSSENPDVIYERLEEVTSFIYTLYGLPVTSAMSILR
jgi:hypothetical protein